jgi:DNA-binding NarL/FixJ family response regulator
VIAEDSGLFRQMLVELLTSRGCEVVGQTDNAEQLFRLMEKSTPDVVLLDIRLPPGYADEGIQAALRIRNSFPEVAVVVFSHYAETSYAMRLLEAGGQAGIGYLVKDRVQDGGYLVQALKRSMCGETVVDPEVVERIISRRRVDDPLDRLSESERSVLSLMAEGFSNASIADQLHCGTKTIEKRVTAIAQKLDLPPVDSDNRSEVNLRVLAVLTYLRRQPV